MKLFHRMEVNQEVFHRVEIKKGSTNMIRRFLGKLLTPKRYLRMGVPVEKGERLYGMPIRGTMEDWQRILFTVVDFAEDGAPILEFNKFEVDSFEESSADELTVERITVVPSRSDFMCVLLEGNKILLERVCDDPRVINNPRVKMPKKKKRVSVDENV